MSTNNQEKITKYLDFPYDTFLMMRFEYSVILGDDLEVRLLRIIEHYIETERKVLYRDAVNANGTPEQPLDITRDIWVPISYKLFMSDLYGLVTSENTVKKALNSLLAKRIIFRKHEPKKRYDAPEYTIHHSALQMLLKLTQGYQKLIPSTIDALRNLPPQSLIPSECQKLIPSEIDLSTKTKSRVSEVDTNFNNSNNKDNKQKSNSANDANAHSLQPSLSDFSSLSDEQLLQEMQRRGILSQPVEHLSTKQAELPTVGVDNHEKVPGTTADDILHAAGMPIGEQHKQPSYVSDSQGNAITDSLPTPPAVNKRTRKPRDSKTNASLTDTTPIPTPEKPSENEAWTPLTCMKLADYYRGSLLTESERKDSKYQKAVRGAIKLVNQQHKTYQNVDQVFRFMKCLDKNEPEGIWDEWWDGKEVDLWHVGDHCDGKLKEIERKQKEKSRLANHKPRSDESIPINQYTARSLDKDHNQRQIEKMRAAVEAKKQAALAAAK